MEALTTLSNQMTSLISELTEGDSAQQQTTVGALTALSTDASGKLMALLGDQFFAGSDILGSRIGSMLFTTSYFDTPLIIAISSSVATNAAQNSGTFDLEADILQDAPVVIPFPQQAQTAAWTDLFLRGTIDGILEGQILAPSSDSSNTLSSEQIFGQALAQGVGLSLITQSNLQQLDSLPLSAEASARISTAVADGMVVLVPNSMVSVNGGLNIAWLQLDPSTGSSSRSPV